MDDWLPRRSNSQRKDQRSQAILFAKEMAAIWTVIYVAPGRASAEQIRDLLAREGFLVQLQGGSAQGEGQVEVLVPASEVEEAHEILTGVLGR